MKILITGIKGNIGKKLSAYLEQCGHEIYGIDIVQDFSKNYTTVNILNSIDLFKVFDKFRPDLVFHLAAMVSRITCESSPQMTIDVNVNGTNNVIELCKNFNCKLIYFSTSEVYGNIEDSLAKESEKKLKPNNIYGLSKLIGEQLVDYAYKNYSLKAVIIRPFMIYDEDETFGENRSAFIRFAESLLKNEKITVHKNSIRSWLHIHDAVRIFTQIATNDRISLPSKEVIIVNVSSKESITTEDLAKKMCKKLDLSYSDFVIEKELPQMMTLVKNASVLFQDIFTNFYEIQINIDKGIDLVIENVRKRLQ